MFHARTIEAQIDRSTVHTLRKLRGKRRRHDSSRSRAQGVSGTRSADRSCERRESMKLLPNQIETNAKTKLTLALCTVLALSGASLRAADDNDKDKDKGGAGTATNTQAGKAGQLSRTDERFIKEA